MSATSPRSPKSPIFPKFQGFQPLAQSANMMPKRSVEIELEKVVTHGSATGVRTGSATVNGRNNSNAAAAIADQPGDGKKGKTRKRGPGLGRRDSDRSAEEEEGTLKVMGKIYSKIKNFSIVTRYFLYVLPLGTLIAVPIAVGASAAKHAQIGGVRILWFFTWIEIVWLALWVSKVFTHFLPLLFQFVVGVVSTGVRKYALVLKALEIPLSLVAWALISFLTFTPVMGLEALRTNTTNHPESWQSTVRHLLAAALVCALIFLGERLLIQLISINYHRKQFSGKIKENKHNIYLLGLLYDASRALFPAYCNEFMEEDHAINDSLNLSSLANSKGSGSATPLKLLRNVGRVGDNVASVFGNIAQEVTGKHVFDPNSAHSIVTEALERKRSCEALAKRLWMSFVVEGHDALFEEDVLEVLGADRQKEASECFSVFDRDGNGDVSLEEAVITITEIGRERASLANSMHDVDQAINVLDGLLSTVVFIISVFVIIAFMITSFTATLATAGTALLSLSFVFAATTQEVLGSCIFLFVKHPYDIGDRVDLTTGTDQLVVEHISLLFTVFKRVTSGRMVQIPNIVLNNLWIENVSRSKAMREQLSIYCAFDTSFEDIQSLKEEMVKFVTAKENSRDFLPDVDLEVLSFDKMDKMVVQIEIKHKSNWANESVRAMRRSKFMCALVLALRRVPIYGPGGGDPPMGNANNPSYSVSISPEVAQVNKDTWSDTKDAKRLYPTKPNTAASNATDLSGQTADEFAAAQQLGARRANTDARDDVWGNDGTASSDRGPSIDGEREPIERQSLEEVSGLIKREPTRGRRHQGGLSPIEEPSTYLLPQSVPPSRTQYAPMPLPPSGVSPGPSRGNPALAAVPSQSGFASPIGYQQPTYIPGNAFSSHPPATASSARLSRSSSLSRGDVPPPLGPLPRVPQASSP